MQLTMRDIEILRFINDFGFCEMSQVNNYFNMRIPRCYQIMSRLTKAELVKAEKLFFARDRILTLTKKGAKHTNLPPLSHIPLACYNHNIHLINIYMKLLSLYPEATWVSERTIKQENLSVGDRKYRHAPDGFLLFPGDTKIAIEVELTSKSKSRWERIFGLYTSDFSIKEVWYYCPRSIFNALQKTAEECSLIKVFDLNMFLEGNLHRGGNEDSHPLRESPQPTASSK